MYTINNLSLKISYLHSPNNTFFFPNRTSEASEGWLINQVDPNVTKLERAKRGGVHLNIVITM